MYTTTPWKVIVEVNSALTRRHVISIVSERPREDELSHVVTLGAYLSDDPKFERAKANAARIVACVNALEGIDDPAAARAVLDDPRTAAATDMIGALRAIVETCHLLEAQKGASRLNYEIQNIATRAIAKAEGRS